MSTFAWPGSVNSRNLVPENVWKHVSLNSADSRTSKPEGIGRGAGGLSAEADVDFDVAGAGGCMVEVMADGVSERVMACTP